MTRSLNGRVAVVTGAGSGIGRFLRTRRLAAVSHREVGGKRELLQTLRLLAPDEEHAQDADGLRDGALGAGFPVLLKERIGLDELPDSRGLQRGELRRRAENTAEAPKLRRAAAYASAGWKSSIGLPAGSSARIC